MRDSSQYHRDEVKVIDSFLDQTKSSAQSRKQVDKMRTASENLARLFEAKVEAKQFTLTAEEKLLRDRWNGEFQEGLANLGAIIDGKRVE